MATGWSLDHPRAEPGHGEPGARLPEHRGQPLASQAAGAVRRGDRRSATPRPELGSSSTACARATAAGPMRAVRQLYRLYLDYPTERARRRGRDAHRLRAAATSGASSAWRCERIRGDFFRLLAPTMSEDPRDG